MFLARDQHPTSLADIRDLDLSGRGVLHLKSIDMFNELTSLESLDLSDHPEFFLTEDQIKEEESKLKEGSPEKDTIEFMKRQHSVDELLQKFKSLKRLTCDEDLEKYILENRESKGFLPKLVEINRVGVKVTQEEQRVLEKNIREVMEKIWMYAGTYRVVSENQMDEENIWYLMDEVGSSIKHSDDPNLAVHPFIYSPNNAFDAHTITYSVS